MVPPQGLKTIVLSGPTAAGKTALALSVARTHPGTFEIINADSMLVYRGMDIGTAKPSQKELKEIPHHLIDIREPDEPFTAGDFVRAVEQTLQEIHSRGKQALIVGGTGFYLKALFYGMWEGPAGDVALREHLESLPSPELYARLEKADPESAYRIGANDRYRLVRAVELLELSGKTPSQLQTERPEQADPRFELWVIDRTPSEIETRIRLRARQMLQDGFVDEVRSLRTRFPQARSLGAVGYKEVCAYLDGTPPPGRKIAAGLEGLQSEIELATRQLVKRQRTWFRNLHSRLGSASHWIQYQGEALPPEMTELLNSLSAPPSMPKRN